MDLASRIRQLRESQKLSQGDIEERTGLRRCYVSRVENGHTVPSIETLEKMARALEVSLYQLFYEGDENLPADRTPQNGTSDWATHRRGIRTFERMRLALAQMTQSDRMLLLEMAKVVARKKLHEKTLAN
jgi:transcriptional regulator with XRE-family HTH domain